MYCIRFVALILVNLRLNYSNLLYRYIKFVVPFQQYPQFKANPVQYYSVTMLIHLEQICSNDSAMLAS